MRNLEIIGRSKNFVTYQMMSFATFTVNNCCKELHLKCGRAPGSLFGNFAMHEK